MTIADLLFLVSALFAMVLILGIAGSALIGRFKTTLRLARIATGFVGIYALTLVVTGMVRPRRIYSPGDTRCFDDWCIAAEGLTQSENQWLATFQVSSMAKRVRQRAPDAWAELEDAQGRRYRSIGPDTSGRQLTDELDPGELFHVSLPFEFPAGAEPVGAVIHHGDFPGVMIIGSDQSILHAPALMQFAAIRRK